MVLDAANRAVRSIVNLPQPVVAVVQGPAAGVGASLALASDVVLASEKAFFMLAFTKIGLMPDGGASALIAAAVGRIRAMRMALLAERIPAAEAYEWGLVTAVYPADEFDAEVDKVISTLVSGPAVALRKTKNAINAATLTELEAALGAGEAGPAGAARVGRLPRGHAGVPAAPGSQLHRLLKRQTLGEYVGLCLEFPSRYSRAQTAHEAIERHRAGDRRGSRRAGRLR